MHAAPSEQSPRLPEAAGLGARRGAVIAAVVVAVINALTLSLLHPAKSGRGSVRLVHHLYDSGQHWALGLLALGLAGLAARLRFGRVATSVLLGVPLSLLLGSALWSDLSIFVQRVGSPRAEDALKCALAAAVAAVIVVAWHLARLSRRQWLAIIVAFIGISGLVANHVVLPDDYAGVHLTISVGGATLLAAALSRVHAPAFVPGRLHPAVLAVVFAFSAWSAVTRPPNAVLLELLRSDASSIAPVLASFHARRAAGGPLFAGMDRWLARRTHASPVPASKVPRTIQDPIVLLITIDGVRFDLLQRSRIRKRLPTLSHLSEHSVNFTNARTPGTQTVYTLTSLFAGTYFSQQYWSKNAPNDDVRVRNGLFPHADDTVRFPQVLQAAGIRTVTLASSCWLVNAVGVVRGFDEERFVMPKGRRETFSVGSELTTAAIERITGQGRGPMFFFMHYLDPHAPYDRGGRKGSQFERYLGEIRYVDRELGRLLRAIERAGLSERTVLIVSSDHGQAFGEHGTRFHASTLYDELLRVPLFVVMPGIAPRRVREPVSLMDLGPTILDIFGESTPGHFLGESLLGLVHGSRPVLSRPIIAEGRLKKAWVFPDGYKLVTDDRSGTVELYDLNRDPPELDNLAETNASANARLATLDAFFDAHRIDRPGYEVPMRR